MGIRSFVVSAKLGRNLFCLQKSCKKTLLFYFFSSIQVKSQDGYPFFLLWPEKTRVKTQFPVGKLKINDSKQAFPVTSGEPNFSPAMQIAPSSSRNQIEDLEHVFRKFDANGDGKISWSELGSIMSSLGERLSEEELQRMVKEADSDGDGFIDLQEFIELNVKDLDQTAVLEDLRGAFLVFDLDRKGAISPEELCKVLRSLGDESTVADCRRMISGVDCDGDGLISFEEFKLMMMGSSPQIRG